MSAPAFEAQAKLEALAARLAEVEAERDEAWKFAQERIEKQNVETGKRVDLIHEREAFRAERDRLAQELEDAQTERDGLLMQNDLGGERLREMAAERDRLAQEHDELLAEFHEYAEHQSWRCGHAPHYYLVGGEALESCPCGLDEVLARFPVKEGDEG